jgi:hypothetical protein
MTIHPPKRTRRVYRRRRTLPDRVRNCGREGVARARDALDHPEPEQLELEISPAAPLDGRDGADERG